MPAKVKGRSEYKSNFKWLESFRGKEFKPAAEQMAPPAGMGSLFSSISMEPPIQHKKRVDGPPASLSYNFNNSNNNAQTADDFAILGQQEKFAQNVPYGLRQPKPSKGEKKEAKASKDQPPPPKQMKLAETKTRASRKLDLARDGGTKKVSKENVTPSSPPPAPRKMKHFDGNMKQGLKDKNLSDILPTKPSRASKDVRNEFVQTHMDKKIALSAQEAPADYSLQYKAGIAPKLGRKGSEYMKEFGWKKGIAASPLLSAEQIIHKSNAGINPVKGVAFQKKTEYMTQFQEHKVPEAVSFAPPYSLEPPFDRQRSRTQVRTQVPRSKSVGAALSPDRTAGSKPVTSSDDPRQLRGSYNTSPIVSRVPIPHGKLKNRASEYHSNFKAPTAFSYEEGVWRNAYPPQLLNVKDASAEVKDNGDSRPEEKAPNANWYSEVLELRRRANEYKKRAQGTHFSREHLVQLLAQQARCWDDAGSISSASAANLDALALQPARPAAGLSAGLKEEPSEAGRSDMAVCGDLPKATEGNHLRTNKRGGRKGKRMQKSKTAWQEEAAPEDLNVNQNANTQTGAEYIQDAGIQADLDLASNQDVAVQAELQEKDESEECEGRLPTPVLRQQRFNASRHHLDRTTPSLGGILLSAPAEQLSTDRSGETGDAASEFSSHKVVLSGSQLKTCPILGKPTPDTHPLRDDDEESDNVLRTQFVASPMMAAVKADRQEKAAERKLSANVPATIDERMGLTYNKDIGNFHAEDLPLCDKAVEDDVLSLSAMSIASSCSLASQVYERARRRRDDFWGKPGQ